MSHFYGVVSGQAKTQATRRGSKDGGIETYCASWEGAVHCYARAGADGVDYVHVRLVPWGGHGTTRTLYHGPISGQEVDGEQK